MTRKDNISIPRWFLEAVEDTLRIQNDINLDKKTEETCQDRNIRESLNGVRKLLSGEELTGMERLEKLHPSLSSNLDGAAKEYLKQYNESEFGNGGDDWDDDILITFKAGAMWMAGQKARKEE